MEKFIFFLGQAGPQLLQNMSLLTEETSFISSQNPSSTAQGKTNKDQFLGKTSRKNAAVLLDFVQITSPLPAQFGELVQLF